MKYQNIFLLGAGSTAFLKTGFRSLSVLGMLLFLQGCSEMKKTLGIERTVPEEFDVVENTPLIIPPHSDLPAPVDNGSLPLNTSAPQEAEAALLGIPVSVPKIVPVNVQDSSIKRVVDAEAKEEIPQDKRPEWLQNLFFWQKKKAGTVLNPEEESEKLKKTSRTLLTETPEPQDAFLTSPETMESFTQEAPSMQGGTSVHVPDITDVKVSAPVMTQTIAVQPADSPVFIPPMVVPPVASVIVPAVVPVAKTAQELYGGVLKKRESVAVGTSQKTFVPHTILLTKALPSKAVIKQYIDVHKKKPKVIPADVKAVNNLPDQEPVPQDSVAIPPNEPLEMLQNDAIPAQDVPTVSTDPVPEEGVLPQAAQPPTPAPEIESVSSIEPVVPQDLSGQDSSVPPTLRNPAAPLQNDEGVGGVAVTPVEADPSVPVEKNDVQSENNKKEGDTK